MVETCTVFNCGFGSGIVGDRWKGERAVGLLGVFLTRSIDNIFFIGWEYRQCMQLVVSFPRHHFPS